MEGYEGIQGDTGGDEGDEGDEGKIYFLCASAALRVVFIWV